MCETWLAKYTPKGSKPAPASQQSEGESGGTVETESGSGGNVVNLADAAAARKPAPKPKPDVSDSDANHIKLGSTVIAVIKGRGDDLIFTEKAAWRCSDGIWTMATDGMSAWLNVEIETGAKKMGFPSNNKLISETRQWIQRQKQLWRDDVPWDQHGKVPTRSGLVDPRTLEVEPILPEHYATWRIEADYDPAAECPWWLRMLEDCFEDRPPEDRAALIGVIQEVLGAGLIDAKPRALSKAMIFQGGSNFGKSGLLEVMGGLFGQDQNSTPIEALEGAHGMMPFVKRLPWVLHEAFDQRKWHFSSAVKAIITGEPISVNVKNGPMLSLRIRAPIFWGTNHPPQFKEATKAIVNRMVIIECRREFIEGEPVGAAVEAFKKGMDKPSSMVLAEEKPGLLKWALDGLKRALERGYLSLTADMKSSADDIRRDSNLVAGFLEECIVYDQDKRVSVPDFCLALAAWWKQNKGEDRNVPSNESISKALVSMADPMIAINSKELRDNKRRYYAGIALNEEGLAFHMAGYESRELDGKLANTTEPKGNVNSVIPFEWRNKGSIHAMRVRHRKGVNQALTPTVTDSNNCHQSDSVELSLDSSPPPQLSYEESLVAQGLTKF
jgi:phage/plasmid-associated DNA primase